MKVAVIGATGTAGSRTVAKLKARGLDVAEVSRSGGVDLITGAGLEEALVGVDAAIDASNPVPADGSMGVREALASAARNVVAACVAQKVGHLVVLSITGIEAPVFEDNPYYAAKRDQEAIVSNGGVPYTVVKSSQWFEFATNPAAVTFRNDEVVVEDWLIQPVAVDSVAALLVDTAVGEAGSTTVMITGPEVIRLPELTARLLARHGDPRPVRATPPLSTELADGVLLAPEGAMVRPPDVETWLATSTPPPKAK